MMTNEKAAKTEMSGTRRLWRRRLMRWSAMYQNGAEAA